MKLLVRRFSQVEKATIGLLFLDGKFRCYTLEDKVQSPKVPGETAIPAGTYKIEIQWSPKFQRNMPRLQNVPDFEGILIHWGNTDVDTAGCILVGSSHEVGRDFVGKSRVIFDQLYEQLLYTGDEGISIEIIDDF